MEGHLFACICEGAAERVIINKLLDAKKLLFQRNELLDKEVLKCRNAQVFEERYLGKSFDNKITVYRILDSRGEVFRLRPAYKDKVDVINVITAPEIEMLIIINEGKYKEYEKYKSHMKPSEYCKGILKMRKVKSTTFVDEYFSDVDTLVYAIKEYKRITKTDSNIKLADILC